MNSNDCFAWEVRKGVQKCRVLLDRYAIDYQEEGSCGNDACPFYKPRGKEKSYIRGFDRER